MKDKKILYHLDINSRQSYTQIGRIVGLPKSVVSFRVNRLIESGIIKKFYTEIDAYKLGYNNLRFYLTYQNTNPEKEKEIINHIVKSKYSWWVASVEGIFILHVNLWVKNMSEFIIFWHDILSKYSNYFLKKELFFISESRAYHQSYLLNYEKRDDIANYEIISSYSPLNIDEIDKKILRMLGNNSRCSIVEIAKNTNLSSNYVKKRIKRLIDSNLIQKFRLEIDVNKIGYEQFKVHIYLNKYNKIDSIINYLKLNPHLVYINKSAGHVDLEISFHHEKIGDLYPIMEDLTNNFPGVIRNYIYFHFPKIHKHTNLPFD